MARRRTKTFTNYAGGLPQGDPQSVVGDNGQRLNVEGRFATYEQGIKADNAVELVLAGNSAVNVNNENPRRPVISLNPLIGTGTVTSVGLSMPEGFEVADSPIESEGVLSVSFEAGYRLFTEAELTSIGERLDGIDTSIEDVEFDVSALQGTVTSVSAQVDTNTAKLATIESGAQVNVKPDWLAPPANDDGILNRPTLGSAALKDAGLVAGNVPVLDGTGKLDASVLPAIAISEPFVVASQAAMLALTAQKGDIAIRTDLNKCFVLSTNSPGTLADWKELLTPTDAVLSVVGLTGAISRAALLAALALSTNDLTGFSANGRSLVNAADYAAMRTLLSLVPGTNVQAFSSLLSQIAALSLTGQDGKVLGVQSGALALVSQSGGGGMNKDPRLLGVTEASQLVANVQTGGGMASYQSNNVLFWNNTALNGAVVTTYPTLNAWSTICDVTGMGMLTHVFAPTHTGANDTIEFRITVDGVAYTISRAGNWSPIAESRYRAIMGPTAVGNALNYFNSSSAPTIFTYVGDAGTAPIKHFNNRGLATVTPGPTTIMSPRDILFLDLQKCIFTQSLKVEVRVPSLFTGDVYGAYHGAMYKFLG